MFYPPSVPARSKAYTLLQSIIFQGQSDMSECDKRVKYPSVVGP